MLRGNLHTSLSAQADGRETWHQRMVIGWLVNANTQVYCLRDGLTTARLKAAADRATPKEQP